MQRGRRFATENQRLVQSQNPAPKGERGPAQGMHLRRHIAPLRIKGNGLIQTGFRTNCSLIFTLFTPLGHSLNFPKRKNRAKRKPKSVQSSTSSAGRINFQETRETVRLTPDATLPLQLSVQSTVHPFLFSNSPFFFISKNKGLISTDRGTKTTLMRTIPRSILSRIQRICLFQYLNLLLSIDCPAVLVEARAAQSYDLGAFRSA